MIPGGMSDLVIPKHDPHLPECPWPTDECSHTPMQDREPLFCMDCLTECICDRLRACEQRIRQAIVEQLRAEFPKPTLGIQKAIRMVDGS